MTQANRLPFGTALALAQRVLSAPLAAVLDEEAVAMPAWFTLNALGLRGASSVEALSGLLATNGLDGGAARELLDGLQRSGLVEQRDGVVALTGEGEARYARLRDRVAGVSARIFERFDAGRVETARGLLQEIAQIDPGQLTAQVVGAAA